MKKMPYTLNVTRILQGIGILLSDRLKTAHLAKLAGVVVLLLLNTMNLQAQYLETFSVSGKGYQLNCVNNLSGVNWSLSAWDASGTCQLADLRDPTDYFNTTVAGVMECIDLDQEVYWESPLINTIAAGGTISLHVDLSWVGFDVDPAGNNCIGDYIRVLYSVNGGAYVMVPNQVGGNPCATIAYPLSAAAGQPFNSSTTVNQAGISGGSNIRVRVAVFTNANAEIVTIDNVSIPEAGVTLNCTQPVVTTSVKNIVCNGASSGSINVSATGAVPPYNVSWTGPSSGNPAGNEIASSGGSYTINGLAAGAYNITVIDAASCSITTTATIINSPIVQSAITSSAYCSQANGTIDLSPGGGNSPYTYLWSNGATTQDIGSLVTGNYSVTITDASVPGCTSNAGYTVGAISNGPYNETFSVANKGYLINQVNNFFGVNWSMSPWTFNEPETSIGRGNDDYFQTTALGKLEVVDTDQDLCWLSPELNISSSGTVNFSLNLAWTGFDDEDYINVQYSINGGAFVTIPNQVGGGIGTIQNAFPSVDQNGSFTVTQSGISGNKLQIKVCVLTNSQADVATLDNVNVPQTVSLCFCPTINFTATPANTCSGSNTGQIVISGVSGGSGPYTYSKDNGSNFQAGATFTGLAAGTYQVVVKDANNCLGTTTVVVSSNASPAPSITGNLAFCAGSSTSLNAGVFSGYNWSTGATTQSISVNTAGTFTVTVTNGNGCTGSANATTTINANPSPTITGNTSFCAGGSSVLNGGAGFTAYSWSTGATTQTITVTTSNAYVVTVTSVNGCTGSSSVNVTVNPNTTWFFDGDGDGYHSTTQSSCVNPGANWSPSTIGLDCDDNDSAATVLKSWYLDADNDGYFIATQVSCNSPGLGWVSSGQTGSGDCNDTNNLINPGAAEINCNNIDENCNGMGDDGAITSVTISGNTTFCSGSSTILDAGSGFAVYNWSTGATTQTISVNTANTFTVTVTNGFGCTGIASATTIIANCCNISLNGIVTQVSCNGGLNGSINVSSSNAFGSPTYLWNNGNTNEDRSGLASGTYTVTVDYGNGCTASQSFQVTQPAPLAINATPANIICRGANSGSISLAPTGGTAPYSYLWNNGSTAQNRTSLSPGTYTVTVNDANLCGSSTASFSITQPATLLIINSNKTNVRCNGAFTGSVVLTPSGGVGPYSYSWNTIPVKTTSTVSALAAGAYTCSVTDAGGCTKTIIITITEPPALVVVPSQTNVSFPGGNDGIAGVTATGGTPGYTYSWNTSPVRTTATITGLLAGVYKCTISDSKSCQQKITITITEPVNKIGTSAQTKQPVINTAPNPSNGIFMLSMAGIAEHEMIGIQLLDVAGRIVYKQYDNWKDGEERLVDFSALEAGVYYLQCRTQEVIKVQKIVIQ